MPRKFSPPSGTFQRSSSPSSIWSLIGDWTGISNEWSMISFLSVHPRSRNTLTKNLFFSPSLHHRDDFLQLFSLKHTFLCCSSSIKVHPDRNITVWRSCCSVKIPRCNQKVWGNLTLRKFKMNLCVFLCEWDGTGTQENVTKKLETEAPDDTLPFKPPQRNLESRLLYMALSKYWISRPWTLADSSDSHDSPHRSRKVTRCWS